MAGPKHPRLLLRLISRAEAEFTLGVATDIGRALGADLAAVFIEEEDALAACALPFATILGPQGAMLDVDRPSLETLVRREAAACERLVRRMAEQARLRWSFRAGRGRMESVLAGESRDDDIIVVRVDRFSFRWRQFRSFAADIAPRQGGILVVPDAPSRAHRRVIVAVTGGDQTAPPDLATRMATRIARAENGHLMQIDAADLARGHAPPDTRLVVTRINALTEDLAGILRAIRAPVLVLR